MYGYIYITVSRVEKHIFLKLLGCFKQNLTHNIFIFLIQSNQNELLIKPKPYEVCMLGYILQDFLSVFLNAHTSE